MRGGLRSYLMMTMMRKTRSDDPYIWEDSLVLFQKISKITGLGRHMLSVGIVGV